MKNSPQAGSTAVLLIAHGSRRPEANRDLAQLAERVRERGSYSLVEIAYLDLARPQISEAAARCVALGAKRVLMLPYFLSAGSHVVEDLERHRREAAEKFPEVEFHLCPPLGLDPLMVDLVMTRLLEGQQAADSSP